MAGEAFKGVGARVIEAALIGVLAAAGSSYVAQVKIGAQVDGLDKRMERVENAVFRPAWEAQSFNSTPGSGLFTNGAAPGNSLLSQ